MDMNEEKNAADYKDFILPPASLTATQGESKAVVLTWPAVKNAVQYQVFAAESPFSTFSKVSETTSTETEITIEEEAGITKYYCISAVNYYGTVSSKSVVAMGSTLAVPIITAIDASEEGNSVSVSWWMDNCSSETYADDVSFNVNVYALSAPNIKFQSLTVDGDTRQVEIGGLTSKTEYYFEVEVVKADSTSKECSEKTSAETAHRVIPDAPLDFTVTQGDSVSAITLSWTLPEEAWYRENAGVSGFALHPLYFEIYRKLSSAPDSEYKKVYEYHADPLDSYTPGDQKTWEDKVYNATTNPNGVERGKKYSYYIQSITDDTPEGKYITAESSKTDVTDGWLISVPRFSIIATPEIEENESGYVYKSFTFKYDVLFENFGKNYVYFTERTKYDIEDAQKTNGITDNPVKYNSLAELKDKKEIFNNPASEEGYYRYTLYICPLGSSDVSSPYIIVSAAGYYLVTDDANLVPKINSFTVNDGYKDHFELSWDYNKDYTYTINWTDFRDGTEQTGSYEIPEDSACFAGKNSGDTVTYNHEANSGDRRIYNIVASTGLPSSPKYPGDDTDTIYETLGTARPEITSYEYDRICVKWSAVQKAFDDVAHYTVSAKYQGINTQLATDSNTEIVKNETTDGVIYECTISKPDGYNDANWSGKNIDLTVTAESSSQADTTTSSVLNVYTIGPAATKVSIDIGLQADSIGVKWTPVADGVDGYLIRRIAYKTTAYTDENLKQKEDVAPDVYYYDNSTGKIFINGEEVSLARAKVELSDDGKYLILTDKYKEASSAENPYEINQGLIAWGIPFGYTVIPVKKGGSSSDDFDFAGKTVKIRGEATGYSNIMEYEYFGSTSGYGLKVFAEKAENTNIQIIRWSEPYKVDTSKGFSIYYREAGVNTNEWNKIVYKDGGVSGEQHSALITIIPQNKTKAYEYLVAYGIASPSTSVPSSFINDNSLGLSLTDENIYDYTGVTVEKANKGYLFAVNYSADTGTGTDEEDDEYYSEEASWDEWDFSKRSIGPTSAVVRIVNYNLSPDAIAIAELDRHLHFKKSAYPENTVVLQGNDAVSIKLWPEHLMMDEKVSNPSPVTKGPLQVLRDAKHYYSIELIRGDKSVILDNSVYAYRNISKKELVKCALLTMSYGFYIEAGGLPDYSNVGNKFKYVDKQLISGGKGTANFAKGSYQLSGKYNAKVTMDNYTPLQKNPAGTSTSVVSVSMSNITAKIQGTADYYLFKFETENFNVSVRPVNDDSDEIQLPSSYSADLVMSCTGYDKLKISINNQSIVNTSDKEIRKVYFPLQIHTNDDKYWIVDPTYGFWTE